MIFIIVQLVWLVDLIFFITKMYKFYSVSVGRVYFFSTCLYFIWSETGRKEGAFFKNTLGSYLTYKGYSNYLILLRQSLWISIFLLNVSKINAVFYDSCNTCNTSFNDKLYMYEAYIDARIFAFKGLKVDNIYSICDFVQLKILLQNAMAHCLVHFVT